MPRAGVFSAAATSAGFNPPPREERQEKLQTESPESQASPLSFAARIGDLKEVRRLLQAKSDPNSTDAVGETPLFEAAAGGDVSVVATLLLAGADPDHQSLIGSVALDLSSSRGSTVLLRLSCGEEVSLDERTIVLQALVPDLRPSIKSFMQSLSGEPDSDDDFFGIDIDSPPKLINKSIADEDGDDWTFAAHMVDQARKSRAKLRHKRPAAVEQIELKVSHALNECQLSLHLMSNNTWADAKKEILRRLEIQGQKGKKIYLMKKERSAYQAYKDTDQIGHVREVRLIGANLPLEGNPGSLLYGD
eukprot:TRINITY_DN24562_c0_g1_i2.p1 TRINITY_DN24562_c0_g1~~TRINITY_DN24562_c0_g1_i2.p1  ORF type:complete len:305 (+),score=56.27 TRINITY_DN24562_c0_g1_i2:53-967(+)